MPQARGAKGKGQDSTEETQRYAVQKQYKVLNYEPNNEWSPKIKDMYNKLELKLGNYYLYKSKLTDEVLKMIKHKRFLKKEQYEYAWDNEIYAMVMPKDNIKIVENLPSAKEDGVIYLKSLKIKDIEEGKYLNTIKGASVKLATEKDQINFMKRLTKIQGLDRFKDEPNLDWLVLNEQEIIYRWLKHIHEGKIEQNNEPYTLNTLKDFFKLSNRYLRLMLGGDNELRLKFSVLYQPLSHLDDWRVGENLAGTDVMYFPDLLDVVDTLEKKGEEEYRWHLNFLAVAVMVWDYPSRSDKFNTKIISKEEEATTKGTYLIVPDNSNTMCKWIFKEDKKDREANKNTNEVIDPSVPRKLDSADELIGGIQKRLDIAIKNSLEKYPREYLFTAKNNKNKKVSATTVSDWIRDLVPGRKLGIDLFRHSMVSGFWSVMNNNQLLRMAYGMLSSTTKLSTYYRKKIDTPEARVQVKLEPTENDQTVVNTQYGTRNPINIRDPVVANAGFNGIQPAIPIRQPAPAPPPKQNKSAQERWDNYKTTPKYKEYLKKKEDVDKEPRTYAMRYVRELNHKVRDWDKISDTIKEKYQLYKNNNKFYSHLIK